MIIIKLIKIKRKVKYNIGIVMTFNTQLGNDDIVTYLRFPDGGG